MVVKTKNKSKTEKPPAIDKLLKPAIGVVLAFLGYYFMKGLDANIPRIDVNDELALREVFFGEGHGQSYVVLCNTPPKEDDTTKPLPISSVFQDAMDELSKNNNSNNNNKDQIQFVLMDCTHTLPTSGKTIAQKFKLDLKQRPSIFISSPKLDNNVPKQIPNKHLKTGHMLAKLVKQMLLPHTQKIESSKDFKNKCLNSNYCALLLKGKTPDKYLKDAIHNLLQKYGDSDDVSKKVTFASLDSTTMYLTGLEEFLPEFTKGTDRFVVFEKVSGGIKEGDSRLITSMKALGENESLSHNTMENLILSVTKGGSKSNMKKLSSIPQVKTRTKKLEEQERAKRQRKVDAKKEKEQKAQQKHSGENDGSKEGRKAERERRREEHRKNNPDYREKTPEEIAEMERKRRQRMEEESKKWNMEAEDAPPEGEPVDDYGEYDDYDLDDEEDEEGEDVLDLD